MYIIKNNNPLRDKYYRSNSGGDYIKAPGTLEYHTDISRATTFPTIERATKVSNKIMSSHKKMLSHPDQFTHDHEMTHETRPKLEVLELVCTTKPLSVEDQRIVDSLK